MYLSLVHLFPYLNHLLCALSAQDVTQVWKFTQTAQGRGPDRDWIKSIFPLFDCICTHCNVFMRVLVMPVKQEPSAEQPLLRFFVCIYIL